MGLKELLEIELARAESIVKQNENSKKKRHQPTIENHKGQAIALRKALSWLEAERLYVRDPVEIKSYLTISWGFIFWSLALIIIIYAIF